MVTIRYNYGNLECTFEYMYLPLECLFLIPRSLLHSFAISVPITSDLSPKEVERKMHMYLKSEMGRTKESLTILAVKMYASKDIYEKKSKDKNSGNANIDKKKLQTIMDKCTHVKCPSRPNVDVSVNFLLNTEKYGVDVVAYIIRR